MAVATMPILPSFFSSDGPGAALAVAADGEDPRFECLGLADVEQGVEITADTVFDLASGSKMFTATAILQLVESDRLELEAPAEDCLAQFRKPSNGRSITVRDLLQHSSGLPDYLEDGMYAADDRVSPAYIFERLPDWSRQAVAGREHCYCNTNFFLLARILESVSDLPFAAFLRSRLLAPFGLDSTFVLGEPGPSTPPAKGYRSVGLGLPLLEASEDYRLETDGDGGIYSTLRDLVRWQSLFWAGEIVSRRSLDLMRRPGRLDSGDSFDYGLGLQVEQDREGRIWCGHGGSWTNSTTLTGKYLAERTSVIVLSNEVMAPVGRLSQRALASIGNGPDLKGGKKKNKK